MKNWRMIALGSLGIYYVTMINTPSQAAQNIEIFADDSLAETEQPLAEDIQQAQEQEELGENLEEDVFDLDGAAVTELHTLASQMPPNPVDTYNIMPTVTD